MNEKFPQDDNDGMPSNPIDNDAYDMDEGEPSDEGDFVEEDWEAYDEEQYIDDSEGDGGKADRAAAFNKIIIIGAVVVALGVGGFTIFGNKDEGLGLPKMAQTGEPVPVAPGQKVEFHAETKLPAKDSFGITYGAVTNNQQEQEKPPEPPAGILNNPGMIDNIRDQEFIAYDDPSRGAVPQVVDGQPPMPAPIATPDVTVGGTPGLMPMPQETGGDAGQMQQGVPTRRLLPTADEVALGEEGGAAPPDAAQPAADMAHTDTNADTVPRDPPAGAPANDPFADEEPVLQTMDAASPAELAVTVKKATQGADLDAVMERLGNIEDSLARLDTLQASLDDLETRIEKVEKAPVQTAKASSAARSSSSARASAASPAAPRTQWVLKSAQPGKAMVSKKGESDMVDVAIGETLAGLGRITGIYMQDGQWIVQGTNGRITQ